MWVEPDLPGHCSMDIQGNFQAEAIEQRIGGLQVSRSASLPAWVTWPGLACVLYRRRPRTLMKLQLEGRLSLGTLASICSSTGKRI